MMLQNMLWLCSTFLVRNSRVCEGSLTSRDKGGFQQLGSQI